MYVKPQENSTELVQIKYKENTVTDLKEIANDYFTTVVAIPQNTLTIQVLKFAVHLISVIAIPWKL